MFAALVLPVIVADASWAAERITGESLVLVGETDGLLLAEKINPASVVVRSTYLPGGVTFELGRDYRIDAKAGTIARVAGSRIPDFSGNVLFGRKDFDHSQFPGYGNGKFFVYGLHVRAAVEADEPA